MLGNDEELGENPFAAPSGAGGVDAGREPWLGSDRDYIYSEVIFGSCYFNGECY